MRAYRLRCCGCGASFPDDGATLDCPKPHAPALLRSEYGETTFRVEEEASVLRFRRWLPLGRTIASDADLAVYPSRALGARLGLRRLWIAFNGWWPERGATLRTATFKELEATAVLGRLDPGETRALVIASAGNTAAAFADACSVNAIPVVIVIPASAWTRVAAIARIGPTVKIVALEGAEYDDAIAFARRLTSNPDFIYEGGVRNVARRDGLGLVMLAAAEAIGAIPDHYVQAVGSAAGALGVREAAQRLIGDGRFGTRVPRLLLAQNHPFTPLHDAWSTRATVLLERSPLEAKQQLAQIEATVLSNQTPPYAIPGGVREALEASGGSVEAIDNFAMREALALFEATEGIDVDPEAGIATAALVQAARAGRLDPDAVVLLNVTGGGRAARTGAPSAEAPALVLADPDAPDAVDRVRTLVYSTRR